MAATPVMAGDRMIVGVSNGANEDLNDAREVRANFGRGRETALLHNTTTRSNARDSFVASYRWKLFLHMLTCFFIVIHLAANTNYLLFKMTVYARNATEVLAKPWLLLLLSLELFYFSGSIIFAIDNLLPPSKRRNLQLDGHHYPTVDIFLPCCKEPTDVVVDSVRAALKMDYPLDRFKVFVLDDGGDDSLKTICETMQVETSGQVVYLRRTKSPGVPHNFKCGNLNYGLKHSNSEYVVMMDADMILHPSFLRRLLPHIVNSPEISFVQIPQSFYNLPVGDPLRDSCIMCYDKALVHRDSLGSATCIGTGCLFRRKHLNVIGGFQPHSITEDTSTAYALFQKGYRSAYLNEKLQIGLVPWTFEGYVKQRCRWGQGAMQQFRATWRAMLGKDSKLTLILKVLYFWHTGYYFLSFINLLLVGCLLVALMLQPILTVGNEEDRRGQLVSLSYNMIFCRIMFTSLWLQVPLSTQGRNRAESHFWWMSPFFCKMILETFFSYSSTFKFIPTSNIDRNASRGKKSPWMKQVSELKRLLFHISYTAVIVAVVLFKLHTAVAYYGLDDCGESYFIFGLSLFLLSTCAHMMLPVLYILWPTGFQPSQRKSLLKYDADGVPVFDRKDCVPKWYWSVWLYESLAVTSFVFWTFTLWMVKSRADARWCKKGVI